ncbi:MAG: hypothetical protein Q9187_004372 [Circinaria calcarea]
MTWVQKDENWNWLNRQLVDIIPNARALKLAEDRRNEWADDGKALCLFKHTDAILFFGTPFRGIHEWFQKDLPRLINKQHPHVITDMLETFRENSDTLTELRTDFINNVHDYQKPNVGCFLEAQVSNVGKIVNEEKIPKIMLVSHDSAKIEFPYTKNVHITDRLLERNHFNLHNFGKEDRVFNSVEDVLRVVVPKSLQETRSQQPLKSILQSAQDEDMPSMRAAISSDSSAVISTSDSKQTALHIAALQGNVEIAKYLIDNGTPINAQDEKGYTALTQACEQGYEGIFQLLLEAGADFEIRNFKKKTALSLAAQQGNRSMVHQLLLRGANKEQKNIWGETPLVAASRCGQQETVRLLLSNDAAIGARTEDGCTALILAARGGNAAVVRLLLDEGHANINEYIGDGMTALCEACRHGREEAVTVLLAKKASLGAQVPGGHTPASQARKYNKLDVLRMIE